MDNTNADKVNAFATEALSLMNQLENLIGLDARSAQQWCFITFSTILVKKFNTEASKMWDKLNDADEDEDQPLGHTLTIKDLKTVILKTKKKLRRREFNKAFNEDSSLKSDKEKKKKEEEARKAKEEAERRKKESAMQEAYSFQTQTGSGSKTKAPKELSIGDVCDVPNCGQILTKEKKNGGHEHVCQCPQLKKQPTETIVKWFRDTKRKCQHCFAKYDHDTPNCMFRDWMCRRWCQVENKKPGFCNKPHHFALHDPKSHGKVVPMTTSTK